MALPAAPRTANDEPLLYGVDDNAGTNRANAFRAYKTGLLNTEQTGHLGVYPLSGSLANGQTAVSGTAAALVGATTPCQGVLVKALSGNANTVYVGVTGVTSSTGYPLAPGESVGVPCNNLTEVFVIGSAGSDKVAWMASAD